jgi:hypothetical protein
MANANVSLQGQNNGAGAEDALFYKLFTGEVLTAFSANNVMEGRHRIRNISSGKSAAFANTGKAFGRVHTPGEEILGQNQLHSETVITVDDLLIADTFIADIYEAKNHYEVRGEYAKQNGLALARTFDKQSFRVAATAARASNKITGLPGGTSLTLSAGYAAASDAAKAQEFAEALFTIHQNFVEKDVPLEGVFCAVRPVDYFRLVRNKDLLNKDWGGLGSYAMADLPMIAGIPLVVTNHLPSQDDAANVVGGKISDNGDLIQDKYSGDWTSLQAIVMTPEAMGTVKLIDLGLQSEYDIRRQGTLMVARMAIGQGLLRPECAAEIVTP